LSLTLKKPFEKFTKIYQPKPNSGGLIRLRRALPIKQILVASHSNIGDNRDCKKLGAPTLLPQPADLGRLRRQLISVRLRSQSAGPLAFIFRRFDNQLNTLGNDLKK